VNVKRTFDGGVVGAGVIVVVSTGGVTTSSEFEFVVCEEPVPHAISNVNAASTKAAKESEDLCVRLDTSVLSTLARSAESLIGFSLGFSFGDGLTSVTFGAATSETEFDFRSTSREIQRQWNDGEAFEIDTHPPTFDLFSMKEQFSFAVWLGEVVDTTRSPWSDVHPDEPGFTLFEPRK
jgi:hypothetical protein